MRSQNFKSLVAATIGLFAAGTNAQTGVVTDLGSLLASNANLTTYYSLIKQYPEILLKLPSYQGVTVLAPNNAAFDKIPYSSLNNAFKNNDKDTIVNVLQYHILQGTKLAAQLVPGATVFLPTLMTVPAWSNVTGGQVVANVEQSKDVVVFISGNGARSTLTQADLTFTGGVVQIIDSLLIPPVDVVKTTTSFNLTSFQGALYASNRNQTASWTPNMTIFATWNQGFEDLGPAITSLTVEQLGQVMDYHMLPNQIVYSSALTNGTKFTTVQGGQINVLHSGNNVYINSAQIVQTDIILANGIMHVIDNVLNPQGPGAQPNPVIASQAPVFASASKVADIPYTSAIPCTTNCPVTTTSKSSTSSVAKAATTSTHTTSSSKGQGAPMARETGYGAAGLIVAVAGAVMMI